jgi:hypothetical protein
MPTPQELAMALRQSGQDMAGQQMAAQQWQGGQMQGMGAMGGMSDQERMMMQAAQRQQPIEMPQQNYSMGNAGTSSMGSVPMGQTMPNNFGAAMGQPLPQRGMMQSERGLSPEEAQYLNSLGR